MEKKKVFSILGLDATKDTAVIKMAYRNRLSQVNPEDDAEGFKELREAYEEAIKLATLTEEEESELDTPISNWMKRVEQTYGTLSGRQDLQQWQQLLEDEVCTAFESENAAKEALLVFLMDHFRLPIGVWELIELRFQLEASKDELNEKFPIDFVNFVTDTLESKGWFDFSLFEGQDDADVDEFIGIYLTLRKMNDNGQYEDEERLFEKLAEMKLTHPYYDVEKIRYFIAQKRLEEAESIALEYRVHSCNDLYVRYYLAELWLACNKIDQCEEICNEILVECPEHFGAKTLLCECHLQKENFAAAKDGYLELLELDSYNEKLHDGLQRANTGLVEQYKRQLELTPNNSVVTLELAWCYYQNRMYEECRSLAERIEINDETYYDFYNLMSRNYLELEEYEKGYACLQKWLAEILATENDGSDKATIRYNRLGLAYYLMSRCYYQSGVDKADKSQAYAECIKYIDLAVGAEKNIASVLMYLAAKAQVLAELNDYKSCIDVCDEILRIEQGYYPAYLYRQEAYFNLKMAQEVIDDYNSAVEIFPGNVGPYLPAIKVYQIYKQCDDAAEVIAKAKAAGVDSNELRYLEFKNRRMITDDREEKERIAQELACFYEQIKEEPGDLGDPPELLHEQALCYYDIDENQKALDIIEKKLTLSSSFDSLRLRADVHYYLGNHEECVKQYRVILKENPDYIHGHYMCGLSLVALSENTQALGHYLKVAELDPEHQFVFDEISELYKKQYMENYRADDYQKAVEYGKKQVENNPSCYYYTDLGLVYLEGYDMDHAIEAFEEASRLDDTNAYPYNNIGYANKVLGKFDKAYEYYQNAIERIDGDDLLPYWNLAVCHRSTGQLDKAAETYEKIAAEAEDPTLANRKLLDVYRQMGAWDKALIQAKRILDLDQDGVLDYLLELGEIYAFAGKNTEAMVALKKAKKLYARSTRPYVRLGRQMLWVERSKLKALWYFKKAYRLARKTDHEEEEEALRGIVNTYCELGKPAKGVPYVQKLEQLYVSWYGGLEEALNNPEYKKIRLYFMAIWNYNIGRYEKTKQYMEQMKQSMNCAQCTYGKCYEYLELEGMMLELQGDTKGALAKYQEAFELAPDNLQYLWKLNELKGKA